MSSTVAAALALALAASSVSALTPKLLGNFSVTNPSFLLLDNFGSGPVNLLITSFTGNPFAGGDVYNIPDVASKLSNPSSIVPKSITKALQWPNSLTYVNQSILGTAGLLLVADGFLVPGKSTGSVSLVPVDGSAPITLTATKADYFYHKASWIDVDNDGLLDLITARATKPLFGSGSGELVWLKQPASDPLTNVPWVETVITPGPDFFFEIVDFDNDPNTIELVAAEFFSASVTLYILSAHNGTLLHSRVIDNTIGATEGVSLVDFNGDGKLEVMVNNHVDTADAGVFAYEVPANILTGQFVKHTLYIGFKTAAGGIGSASPGFCYAFYPSTSDTTGAPYIAVAGDGALQAYLLTPGAQPFSYTLSVLDNDQGTVGALAVGDVNGDGFVELFIPNFDKNYLNIWTYGHA